MGQILYVCLVIATANHLAHSKNIGQQITCFRTFQLLPAQLMKPACVRYCWEEQQRIRLTGVVSNDSAQLSVAAKLAGKGNKTGLPNKYEST